MSLRSTRQYSLTLSRAITPLCLTLVIACGSSSQKGGDVADSVAVSPGASDVVQRACHMADSLLLALGGPGRRVDGAYDFGASFGNEARRGCEVTFSGFARGGTAIADSILERWQRQGWRPAPRYQADGIGEFLTGMHDGSALCLLNSHLDMNDEGDEGPVPRSDSIDVSVSCTKLSRSDTLDVPTG